MSYGQVQFIAYCIYTGPKYDYKLGTQEYVGINILDKSITEKLDDENIKKKLDELNDEDITERVNLVEIAIETAKKNSDPNENTLKIFMIPEFFFRGAEGAYKMDVYDKLITKLQGLVEDRRWKDWIFVFGTIVAKSSSSFDDKSNNVEGYNISLVQKGGFEDSKYGPDNARIIMKEYMSGRDFLPQKISLDAKGDKSVVVLERVFYPLTVNEVKREKRKNYLQKFKNLTQEDLDKLNATDEEKEAYEKGKSLYTYYNPQNQKFWDLWTKYLNSKNAIDLLRKIRFEKRYEFSEFNYSGTSMFEMEGITFGLEVCLDHANKRLKKSIEYQNSGVNGIVDIQLIPSCGISINKEAIVVRNGGYVFHCDGSLRSKQEGENMGKPTEKTPENEILYYSHSAFAIKNNSDVTFETDQPNIFDMNEINAPGISGIRISSLYAQGAGQLHIYPSKPLPRKALGPSLSQSYFPRSESSFTTALSSEPVLLNGMKVIFDQPTPVYPVTLEPKNK